MILAETRLVTVELFMLFKIWFKLIFNVSLTMSPYLMLFKIWFKLICNVSLKYLRNCWENRNWSIIVKITFICTFMYWQNICIFKLVRKKSSIYTIINNRSNRTYNGIPTIFENFSANIVYSGSFGYFERIIFRTSNIVIWGMSNTFIPIFLFKNVLKVW